MEGASDLVGVERVPDPPSRENPLTVTVELRWSYSRMSIGASSNSLSRLGLAGGSRIELSKLLFFPTELPYIHIDPSPFIYKLVWQKR